MENKIFDSTSIVYSNKDLTLTKIKELDTILSLVEWESLESQTKKATQLFKDLIPSL